MDKISIIVPIYNCEEYLSICIESIINQTYINLEIILIDDGSTDNSAEICREYASRDSRIIFIEKTNGGASETRNTGLDIATGEYIAFVDSDDFISCIFIEELYKNIVDQQCDISICKYSTNTKELNTENVEEKLSIYTNVEMCIGLAKKSDIGQVLWNKLYKKEIFQYLRIPLGMIYEDEAILHEILYNCKKGVITNKVLYYYNVSNVSVMRCNYSLKKIDAVKAFEKRLNYYNEKREEILYRITLLNLIHITAINYYMCKKNLGKEIKTIGELRNKFIKYYKEIMTFKGISLKNKIRYTIAYIFPIIYGEIFSRISKNN